jgi:hypothetical protein
LSPLVFQCPSCRALVGAVAAELQAGRAGLRCEACGAVAWLPDSARTGEARVVDVEPAARAAAPRELPPSSVALVVASPATPVSSGATGAFSADALARLRERLASMPPPSDPQRDLAAAFERLLGTWEGEAGHKELLKRASGKGELAFIGQRYRAVLDVVPNDAAARRAQGEILTLAMGALSATRDLGAIANDPATRVRRRNLVLSVLAFVFAGLLLWAVRQREALLRAGDDGAKMLEGDPAGDPLR